MPAKRDYEGSKGAYDETRRDETRRDETRRGEARRGEARRGEARRGEARRGNCGCEMGFVKGKMNRDDLPLLFSVAFVMPEPT
ncbi:hypothetical protein CCP4SC76_5710003 [Gammaproteobacteria bacterium]